MPLPCRFSLSRVDLLAIVMALAAPLNPIANLLNYPFFFLLFPCMIWLKFVVVESTRAHLLGSSAVQIWGLREGNLCSCEVVQHVRDDGGVIDGCDRDDNHPGLGAHRCG
ncbi:hypothetical protein AAZX31_08G281700 [Glycine max]